MERQSKRSRGMEAYFKGGHGPPRAVEPPKKKKKKVNIKPAHGQKLHARCQFRHHKICLSATLGATNHAPVPL